MLESVTIGTAATFGNPPEALTGLSTFNYLFGSNGTGKTTISRVISDGQDYPNCSVTWQHGRPLETAVLNRDFIDRNFDDLRGVFTLGEQQKETLARLAAAKEERDREYAQIATLRATLQGEGSEGGKLGELAELEIDFRNKCWAKKKKYDGTFHGPFTGYRNDAEKFKAKILDDSQANSAPLKPLNDLEARADTMFGRHPTKEASVPTLATSRLLAHESNPILSKSVIGKSDVDIASMIEKLGNSDWVRQGRTFYEWNNQVCPFCQQPTTDAFAESLTEYFDATFESNSNAIDTLVYEYTADAADIQGQVDALITSPTKFLDLERIKSQKSILDETVGENKLLLEQKKKEPSRKIELKSLATACAKITELVDAAKSQVTAHNHMVDNLAEERRHLTTEVWRFVIHELESELAEFVSKKGILGKAIENLNEKIADAGVRVRDQENKIRDLEKAITSIQPTIDAINAILAQFGFDSFELAIAEDKKSYKLIRSTGEDARQTLSEGEKTFVVFLYFYHLLKGSTSETGITTDRVVVFDDPVSSLDSDILFIVSTLIREVCEDIRQGRGHIKQVFILTHNIYFHKEVTFNQRRNDGRLNEETFWTVRRLGQLSKIERHEENPVKTSYELLWMDVRKPDPHNRRIENTLRRILEHYFTILGSVSPDNICALFEGQERMICKSLFSWVNAGSHYARDDIYITPSDTMVQNYLNVFRSIFEKTHNLGHYRMMMGDDSVEDASM